MYLHFVVQLFCFDKTGTLTKEGLEFYGAKPIIDVNDVVKQRSENKDPAFDKHIAKVEEIPRLMQIGLASCHAVTTLNGQFIGIYLTCFRFEQCRLI